MRLPDNPFFVAIKGDHVKQFRGNNHEITLRKLNEQGFGIHYCPANIKNGRSRKKTSVISTDVLWTDKDKGELPSGLLPPSTTVQTSPGKYHYYWRLSEPITDIEDIEDLLTRITTKCQGDMACTDAGRVLKVPGYANPKNGFDVEVISTTDLVYTKQQIEEAFPLVILDGTQVDRATGDSFDLANAIRNILTGEVIHESRVSMSLSFANQGIARNTCLTMIETILDVGHEIGNIENKRYNERKANNKQVVESAYTKITGEVPVYEFESKDGGSLYTKLPPLEGGGLKVLVEDIMSNMYHPVYEVAVPLAMHLVGMFGSGGYHLDGVTGTKRRAICMRSGSGKDVVSSYIEACIRSLDDSRAKHFKGQQSFTPRTVHAELKEFRCRSYIVSEAGISGQSETGDVANMRAYMLQALAAKVDRALSIKATVQDIKAAKEEADGVMDVHGTVINVIAESTIEAYAKMLHTQNADVTGMMGREELIFPKPDTDPSKSNRKGFTGVGKQAMDVLHPLAQRFLDHPETRGITNNPGKMFENVDTSQVEGLLDEDYIRTCNLKTKHMESAQAVGTQYSRLHEKVKCTAMILAIADTPNGLPVVKPWHIEYSVKYHDALISTVTAHLSGEGSLSGPMDGCISLLERAILKYPGLSRDSKHSLNIPKRIVSKSWLSAVLDVSNCKPFKELTEGAHYGKTPEARKSIINEALDRGLITRTKWTKNTKTQEAFTLSIGAK